MLDASPVVDGSMQAVAVGGDGADTRRAFVATGASGGTHYVVAQVEGGTFQLAATSSSLSVSSGITSILVLKLVGGALGQAAWFVNLHAGVTQRQWFNVNSVAVAPTSGNLLIAGEFAGSLTLGGASLTAQGSFDAFVAEVAQDTGAVVWAQRYGGAGRDAAHDISMGPAGQVLLVGSTASALSANSTTTYPQDIFVAQLGALGASAWWTTVPANAAYFNAMKVRAGQDDIDVAVAVNGPATLTITTTQIIIPQNQAAIVVYSLSTSGVLSSNQPLVISAASNSYAMLNLGDMVKTASTTFVAAGFSGQLLINNTGVAQTPDTYSDGVVVMTGPDLAPAWWVVIGGPGPQSAGALSVQPNNSAVYVTGSAWSPTAVGVTTTTTSSKDAPSNVTFQSQLQALGEGAYVMELATATGQAAWVKLFEGWQDQLASCDLNAGLASSAQLLCAGLFDRGNACKTFNAGGTPTCSTGVRPFYISALGLPPSDALTTTQGTLMRSNAGVLGAGAISGIVIGGIILLVLLALAIYLLVRHCGYCAGRQKAADAPVLTASNPTYKLDGPPAPSAIAGHPIIPVTARV